MIRHFDHVASIYDRLVGPPKSAVLRDLLRLPIEGSMLDGGGGTGRVSYSLRHHVGRMVVADVSLPMLKAAKGKGQLLIVRSSVENLPFADESYERVLVVDALHHFADQVRSLSEIARVLKKGGRVVIEEPDLRRWSVKSAALVERLLLMRSHFLSPASILEIIRRQGLSARIAETDRFRVWIVADKSPQ